VPETSAKIFSPSAEIAIGGRFVPIATARLIAAADWRLACVALEHVLLDFQ